VKMMRLEEEQYQHVQLETVGLRPFREEQSAPGKIAINEDALTPVFSFYTGRIVRLLAKPGDVVEPSSRVLELDTPDLLQNESDMLSAVAAYGTARAGLKLEHRADSRLHNLYLYEAVALKDWEQAHSDLHNAENDVRAAKAALAVTRGRLQVLGKSETEITRL